MKKKFFLYGSAAAVALASSLFALIRHSHNVSYFNANIETLASYEISTLPCIPSSGDKCFTIVTDALGNEHSMIINNMKNYFPGI